MQYEIDDFYVYYVLTALNYYYFFGEFYVNNIVIYIYDTDYNINIHIYFVNH